MEWVTGDAEQLPFEDNAFDVYTIAFGIRNVTHIDRALAEVRARACEHAGRLGSRPRGRGGGVHSLWM
eukprot:978742-Pleurochrysis_carterae.AAC.1